MLTTYLREWDMLSVFVGENIVVFKDNGDMYKTFWNGNIYDIDVWNNQLRPSFKIGTILCVLMIPPHKPLWYSITGFYDVEQLTMPKYKSGRGFIVYEDLGGNLWYYKDGENFNCQIFHRLVGCK